METDRPSHRCTSNSTTTTSSELFICFTSRLSSSSSSMKISSKSILSPGRARDSSQISLSTSLSRRLRSSGSIKGGAGGGSGGQASPMFPATSGKKRGCNAFENPEPSSPKVTCIGQVRVKTKKQGKKMRPGRSKSRREVSFRKTDQTSGGDAHFHHQFQQQEQRNQRWVHLPVTICEALRAFGAEFNCFFPCRSSCMANNNNKEERGSNSGGCGSGSGSGSSSSTTTSCGAVFARWLVAEKIELVVGDKQDDDDDDEDDMRPRRSQRRHVFEDIVIEEAEKNEISEDGDHDKEEEERRVSICIPPKNALLLMRCRSDPVKMAALANRFWECPPPPDETEEDNEENENENGGLVEEESHQDKEMEQKRIEDCEKLDSFSHVVEEEHGIRIPEVEVEVEAEKAVPEVLLDSEQVKQEEEEEDNQLVEVQVGDLQKQDQEEDKEEEKEILEQVVLEEEIFESASSPENEDKNEDFVENEAETAPKQEKEEAFDEKSEQEEEVRVAEESTEETQNLEKMLHEEEEEEEEETVTTTTTTHEGSEPDEAEKRVEHETGQQSKERENENKLPDCLLLMMCEPKLSMEVSKETWVCSTDFIRWHPLEKKPAPPQPQPHQQQIVNKTDGSDQPKKRVSIDLPPAPQRNLIMQPPRSSCSFPAAPPLALAHGAQSINTMLEQKLVGAKSSYEPFVLTRCKSEPMRSSAKLAPEACFWKNRKLEPHRPAATLGVGAAGVGF